MSARVRERERVREGVREGVSECVCVCVWCVVCVVGGGSYLVEGHVGPGMML